MRIRVFTLLLALSAITVAGMAAFFSVYGIAKLFAGSLIPVAIMAGSLELAKLVTASFLYRYWRKVRWHLKTYFSLGVLILMIITSAGIVGYLTNSYQGTTVNLERQQTRLDLLESEASRLTQDKERLQTEKEQYQTALSQEMQGLVFTEETRFLDTKRRKEAVQRFQPLIDERETRIQEINDKLITMQSNISDLKLEMIDTGVDIGPLVYLARLFNTSMDTVVKYFIFMIIFVFDPLAVALVIATNMVMEEDKRKAEEESAQKISADEPKKEYDFSESTPSPYTPNAETRKAIEDADKGIGLTELESIDDLFDVEEDKVFPMKPKQAGKIVGTFYPEEIDNETLEVGESFADGEPEYEPTEDDASFLNEIDADKQEEKMEEPEVEPQETEEKPPVLKKHTSVLKKHTNSDLIVGDMCFKDYLEFAKEKRKHLGEIEPEDIEDVPDPDDFEEHIPAPKKDDKKPKKLIKKKKLIKPMTEEEIRIEMDRIFSEAADQSDEEVFVTPYDSSEGIVEYKYD